jgi:hypothetical protein
MKNSFKFVAIAAMLFGMSANYAVDMGSIVKAQVMLGQVSQIVDKYAEIQALLDNGSIELDVPEPAEGNTGKFYFPFNQDGYLTAWADKALNAQVGAEAGALVADQATGALASRVPFGGLVGGALKGKAKETGAVMAVGGWDFIESSSDTSFNSLNDMSVYMHVQFYGDSDYEQALAAATSLYPKLERGHERAVAKAYKDARKAAAKRK